jgi:hypothetical protein
MAAAVPKAPVPESGADFVKCEERGPFDLPQQNPPPISDIGRHLMLQ